MTQLGVILGEFPSIFSKSSENGHWLVHPSLFRDFGPAQQHPNYVTSLPH